MSWTSKPIWTEGMFLHPQHFQQQDRHFERLLEARAWPVSPYPWGFTRFEVDTNALRQGRFALTKATGIAPDGTPFAFPDDDSLPASIDIPRDCRDELVYLAIAERREGIRESSDDAGEGAITRVRSERVTATNANAEDLRKEEIEVGRLRWRLMLHRDNRSGFSCLPVARVSERSTTGEVQISPDYIPPCLSAKDNDVLQGYLREVFGLIRQRADLLGQMASRPGYGAGAELIHFLWLVSLNRAEPLFAHLLEQPATHPAQVYAAMASLAGELCSFSRASRRAAQYPAYAHDSAQQCFAEVMDDLRRSFRMVIDQPGVPIPLEKDDTGALKGQLPDVTLARTARFILIVQSSARSDKLRIHFPGTTVVASSDMLMQFVQNRTGAIGLRPLETAPPELPYQQKAVYFELLRDPDPRHQWNRLETTRSLGIYVTVSIPDLALELWAIRPRA